MVQMSLVLVVAFLAAIDPLALAALFALPWIAAVVWVSSRVGWRVLWSENGEEFPTQATILRSFGHC
jgi:hypothetical protein